MKHRNVTLPNNLQVLIIDTESFPTVTTMLMVGAGSRFENEKNNGIAHFFEHMAFKGSKKYENSFVISSTIEGLGGAFNAFTSKDHTGYWIKSTTEHFDTVVDVLSDMVLEPKLLAEEIEREKGVIVEEINMYEDTPARRVGELFENLLYKNDALGFDIAGTPEIVRTFNRKTFTDYIDYLYHPENAIFVIAGGLKGNFDRYENVVHEKFGMWKSGTVPELPTLVENQTKPGILVHHKKTEQAHFTLGFRAFSFHDKRRSALSVLSAILGGGMSSRLFIEVRERRGLCYYIGTSRELYHDVGNFYIQAGITNQIDKVKEAVRVTLQECKKIVDGDITDAEIIKAKEMIKGRMLLSMEDSQSVASYFGVRKLLEKSDETPEDALKKIEKVSKEEIIKVAKELFVSSKLNFALIGPFDADSVTDSDLAL